MDWDPRELIVGLRLAVRGVLGLIGLILSLVLLHFVFRFSWRLVQFFDNTIFANPW